MLRVNTGSGRVLRSSHIAILKPQHIHTRAQNHPVLTNKNRTNQDADQEYEAARRRLQQIYATGEHCGKSALCHSLYSR